MCVCVCDYLMEVSWEEVEHSPHCRHLAAALADNLADLTNRKNFFTLLQNFKVWDLLSNWTQRFKVTWRATSVIYTPHQGSSNTNLKGPFIVRRSGGGASGATHARIRKYCSSVLIIACVIKWMIWLDHDSSPCSLSVNGCGPWAACWGALL